MDDFRIVPKPSILRADRRPLIYFVTSSTDKRIQARLIFSKFGLELQTFQEPPDYIEDYSQSKPKLLETGIREVVRSVGSSAIFFLEDTSVRIEAISTADDDRPGLAIKDWFTQEGMTELAREIHEDLKDDRAIVRSDIALHLPGLDRPIYFHGETRGRIAPTPPTFPQDPRYPWLRPDTFNGWLIPDGIESRLGELDFEASLAFDFRAIALRSLVDRIEEYMAALNLPSQAYSIRPKSAISESQLSFMPAAAFVVIGQSCAGKTTFGEHAEQLDKSTVHIEASRVMMTIPLPAGSPEDMSAFTRANLLMLREGHDVVARRIAELYSLDGPFVITGLRTLQELLYLKQRIPRLKVVLIEASEETRYNRYLDRARPGDELSLDRFREKDSEHQAFGLLTVAEEIADIRIRNEGSIADYLQQVKAVLADRVTRMRGIAQGASAQSVHRSQLYRVLTALRSGSRPMSPSEIEKATQVLGRVGRSSARKVLNDAPALVRRTGDDTAVASSYELSEGGRSYLELLQRRLGEPSLLGGD
jgi:inosine/xanthosine triphosphate pyrophosphatase family protein